MVEVAGVIVTVPAPRFWKSANHPAINSEPAPACGRLTATADPFVSVTSLPRSVLRTVYVVPVCALTADATLFAVIAASSTSWQAFQSVGRTTEESPLSATPLTKVCLMHGVAA